jgi:hypothetical protein
MGDQPKDDENVLTDKQDRFIQVYAGNGVEAAREAGYEGDDRTLAVTASRLLRNAKVAAAIRTRRDAELAPKIASRTERQAFWAEVMKDRKEDMAARLRASELLGKSEGDFVERRELSGPDGKPIELRPLSELSEEELDAELRAKAQALLSQGGES